MSSLKRSSKVGQRIHRERSQPEARAEFGHLEKKKDYVKRAKDYDAKKRRLLRLRQKALNKNPDEFYFHMVRSKIQDDGVHHELSPKPDEDTLVQKKLGNIKDLVYVENRLSLEKKKIEKLKSVLHFCDQSATKNTHTIFVDTEKEARNFDPKQYFDTAEELIDRRFNRPRISTLQNQPVINAHSKSDVKQMNSERQKMYDELLKRLKRVKELKVVAEKLRIRKLLAESKGNELKPKKVQKGEPMKARVFRWAYERK